MNNIVLVHGGFVDGSGWEGVYKTLTRNGYSVTVVQNPTISLEADHGRGIHLMKLAMDEVSFEQGGTEVHMCKRPARNARAGARD